MKKNLTVALGLVFAAWGCMQNQPASQSDKIDSALFYNINGMNTYSIHGPLKKRQLLVYEKAFQTEKGWQPIPQTLIMDITQHYNENGIMDSVLEKHINGNDTFKIARFFKDNGRYWVSYEDEKLVLYDTLLYTGKGKNTVRCYDSLHNIYEVFNYTFDDLGRLLCTETVYAKYGDVSTTCNIWRDSGYCTTDSVCTPRVLESDKYGNQTKSIQIDGQLKGRYVATNYEYY